MRKNILWMLAAILILSGMTMMTACSDSDDGTTDDNGGSKTETPVYDLNDVTIEETGTVSMVDLYSLLVQKATEGNDDSDAELAAWAQQQIDAIKTQERNITDSLNNVNGTNGSAYGENWDGKGDYSRMLWYQWATLRYKAPGADGTMKELSELVVWPYGSFHDPHPDHVVIGCHYTITSNDERPTNFSNQGLCIDVNILACFAHSARQEALVVIPDYEGYGATHGNAHPYCNRDVTAVQVIEGAKAAVEWYNNKAKKLNSSEIHQELLATSCKNEGGFKMYCYSNKEKDFVLYTPEAKARNLDFDLRDGEGKSYCTVDQCLKDGVIQYFKYGIVTGEVPEAKLRALRNCLATNRLFDGWRPGDNSGFTFFHSVGDEVVPICNLESVDNAWYVYGKTNEQQPYYYLKNDSDTKLHIATGTSFYVAYVGEMVQGILSGKWQGGRWIGYSGPAKWW